MSRDPDPLVVAFCFLFLAGCQVLCLFKLAREVDGLKARVTALEACE